MSEHFNRMAKHLDQMSLKHDKSILFADFLTVALCCYHTVNIKSRLQEKDPDNEERYASVFNKYDKEDQNTLPKILAEYQLHLRANPYTDPLGDYFQENISNGKQGQYFTPDPICTLMTQLQAQDPLEQQTVYDPACGSGRTLLNFAKDHPKNLFVGNDLNPSCAKMAALNMFFHNLSAEINWMDSISGKWFGGWHINMDKFGIQPIEQEQSIEWNNAQSRKAKTPEAPPIVLDYRTNTKQVQPPAEQMNLFNSQQDLTTDQISDRNINLYQHKQPKGNETMSNNTVELLGYPAKEPQYIEKGKTPFLAFGFATQESYRDDNNEWQQTKPVFHDIIVFKEDVIEKNKGLTTKDRLKITGNLNYEFIKAQTKEGKEATFKKASIIAKTIESAAFTPKDEPTPQSQ